MLKVFGVDSTFPSNTRLTNGYQLYDWVMRMNSFPSFWGRNLSGDGSVSREEIKFLHEKKCKIALVFNDLTKLNVYDPDGTKDALRATAAAKSLGVSQNKEVILFARIEDGWDINYNWVISYARTLVENGYLPGFAGSAILINNITAETGGIRQYNAVYWELKSQSESQSNLSVPLCQDMVSLWSFGEISFKNILVNETYSINTSVLNHMW